MTTQTYSHPEGAEHRPLKRLRLARISGELLCELFTMGVHGEGYEVIENPMPPDARIVNATMEHPYYILLTIESAEFDEVQQGHAIPWHTPTLMARRNTTK